MSADNIEDLRRQFEAARSVAEWDSAAELSQRIIELEQGQVNPSPSGVRIETAVTELPATEDFPGGRSFYVTVIDEEGVHVLDSQYAELEGRIVLMSRYVRPGYGFKGYGTKSFVEGPLALSISTGKPMKTTPLSEDGVAFYRALERKGVVTITPDPERPHIFWMEPGWSVR